MVLRTGTFLWITFRQKIWRAAATRKPALFYIKSNIWTSFLLNRSLLLSYLFSFISLRSNILPSYHLLDSPYLNHALCLHIGSGACVYILVWLYSHMFCRLSYPSPFIWILLSFLLLLLRVSSYIGTALALYISFIFSFIIFTWHFFWFSPILQIYDIFCIFCTFLLSRCQSMPVTADVDGHVRFALVSGWNRPSNDLRDSRRTERFQSGQVYLPETR